MKKKTTKLATYALCIALAFTLSFLETLLPFSVGVPGVKLGLANMVVVAALYLTNKRDAFCIAMIRILITGLVFSGAFSLLYSFAGGILSFIVMLLAQKNKRLSVMGVSVLGGCVHNIGQILVAAAVMQTARIVYYIPVLLVSGALTGALVGLLTGAIVARLQTVDFNK